MNIRNRNFMDEDTNYNITTKLTRLVEIYKILQHLFLADTFFDVSTGVSDSDDVWAGSFSGSFVFEKASSTGNGSVKTGETESL